MFTEKLTSTEIAKLWVSYVGNTKAVCVLSYFLQHIEDPEIKTCVEHAFHLSKEFIETITEIYKNEKMPIPKGFNEEDVNLGAPRLFLDEYYLHYLKYAGKAGISLYGIAIPLMLRPDMRDFFTKCLRSTVTLTNKLTTF